MKLKEDIMITNESNVIWVSILLLQNNKQLSLLIKKGIKQSWKQ
jgi:hypothetical protein